MSKRNYVIFTLLVNGILPWILYVWLSEYMSSLAALTIATLVPLLDNLVHLIKHRKLDAFGTLMLFTFLLTIVLVLLGGSEKILLVRESLITASVGLIFLGSLFFRRPIMYYLALRFISTPHFAENWNYAYFRFVMKLMTFVWGIMLTMEAAVRVVMVYRLPTASYLALSNLVLYGFIGAAVLWTVIYRRHSAAKLHQLKQS
ncbi:VC0807 family protein [Paenibacillus sp. MAH-36]|uniref:VC0807 family protein n=1 Tax=Paenibacillus violae TaxID=3077234 RepID=A0ABU3RCU8_9BACL|nr:VC0807 family protein [Paenibacillus sp. PFR10]MDU0202090.1 VC0807 family protein [Paenibacillus sp. PFR10]